MEKGFFGYIDTYKQKIKIVKEFENRASLELFSDNATLSKLIEIISKDETDQKGTHFSTESKDCNGNITMHDEKSSVNSEFISSKNTLNMNNDHESVFDEMNPKLNNKQKAKDRCPDSIGTGDNFSPNHGDFNKCFEKSPAYISNGPLKNHLDLFTYDFTNNLCSNDIPNLTLIISYNKKLKEMYNKLLSQIISTFPNTFNIIRSSIIFHMFLKYFTNNPSSMDSLVSIVPNDIRKYFIYGNTNLLEFHPLVREHCNHRDKIMSLLCNKVVLGIRIDLSLGKLNDACKNSSLNSNVKMKSSDTFIETNKSKEDIKDLLSSKNEHSDVTSPHLNQRMFNFDKNLVKVDYYSMIEEQINNLNMREDVIIPPRIRKKTKRGGSRKKLKNINKKLKKSDCR